jgi:hypothetical protein
MKPLMFGLCTLLYLSLAAPLLQDPQKVVIYREETRERVLAARISPPQQRGPARQVNVAQLRRDAEELSQLERTIQAELAEAERGVVPKALGENLKKIQKLSKRLRAELFL